jgi:hypothetical protein
MLVLCWKMVSRPFQQIHFLHIFTGPGPAYIRNRQQHFLNVKKKMIGENVFFFFFLNGCKSDAYNLNG